MYRNSGNGKVKYQRYKVPLIKGMTVLDALFYIQDHYDSTLAFRYACRGAICGSCGLLVDKMPSLACKTQVSNIKTIKKPTNLPDFDFGGFEKWDREGEILIEPMPNMNVKKDLVVDMEPFWNFYREVKPYFEKQWNDIAPETLQTADDVKKIERLVYCVLCGLCWACPVNKSNSNYLGSAQLAKSDRFIRDSRISERTKDLIIKGVLQNDGIPACQKYFICNRVCPKGVMPGTAIKDIRDIWMGK